MKKTILIISLLFTVAQAAFAEQALELTLTAKEQQKLSHYFSQDSESKLAWRGDPINIYLPINQEKRIIFENPVSVDLKSALNTDQIKVLNNDKSLYLKALQPFPKTRIYVTDQLTNKVMLIDLSVNENASPATQRIITTHETTKINNNVIEETAEKNEGTPTLSYVDLIRFAWKQTYAPENLRNKLPTYNRVPMDTNRFIANLIYGDKVIAHPEASWAMGGNYITVVFLQNKYHHAASINLKKDICGHWLSATLYPRSNLASSNIRHADSTTLFLVSSKPFSEQSRTCYGNA